MSVMWRQRISCPEILAADPSAAVSSKAAGVALGGDEAYTYFGNTGLDSMWHHAMKSMMTGTNSRVPASYRSISSPKDARCALHCPGCV